MKQILYLGVFTLLLAACQGGNKQEQNDQDGSFNASVKDIEFKSEVKYADRFMINNYDGFKQIVVFDPWNNNDTLASYVLYPKGAEVPAELPPHEFLIPVPIGEIATMSSTHIGTVNLLEEIDKIIGVSNAKVVHNPVIKAKFEKGELPELGGYSNNNFEEIISLSPELLMKTGFDNIRNIDARLTEAGIPLAYNIEWMESHMLGRAEWIKYTGAFFAKNEFADSIFNQIEASFYEVAALVKYVETRPKVMSGTDFKGIWHTPGSKSYIAQLIQQSGGEYSIKNDSSKGSLPLSFEVVLDQFADADIWFLHSYQKIESLEDVEERYRMFEPMQNGNVFNFDKRINVAGGNDYWETGVTRPDIILKDYVKAIHPELLPDHEFYYYRKIPETADSKE